MDMVMTALSALGDAWGLILHPEHFLYLAIGVLLGLAVGIFPGLGGIAGMSMVLPFLFGLEPVAALAMMVGLVAVIPTSDTFASVLLGIPGSSASQATVLDGFPLSKKGHAAKALSAAFASSLFGGLYGALLLTLFILVARPIVLSFKTPELLALTIFGLSMVGVLAGNSLLKGLGSAGLGMLVASIGIAPANGSVRMSFGSYYLGDGIQLVIIGLGIFAIPEIMNLLRTDRSIARGGGLGSGWSDGVKAWWQNRWLSLRCASLGVLIGVIPGLGGSVVDWIAYGHTVQTTRDASGFGKGEIRGVIGPESSNNAKEGGGLVPTILFGIPGSGSMAVFLVALSLLGMYPGPMMLRNELDTTYTIVWSLALANVLGAGLCIFLAAWIAKLTTIRFPLLAPFMFMLVMFAAFQSNQVAWDLIALLLIGVLGIYMKRFDWPRPAFLIGFVLAGQAEIYTYQLTQFIPHRGIEYALSVPVIIILLLTVVSVWMGAKQSAKLQETGTGGPQRDWSGRDRVPQLIFTAVVLAFAVAATVQVAGLPLLDRVFPIIVGTFTSIVVALALLVQFFGKSSVKELFDEEMQGEEGATEEQRSVWQGLLWFIFLLAVTLLVGFFIALILFFLGFLRFRAKVSWPRTIFLSACGIGFMLFLAGVVLDRLFPGGLLQAYFELPWPLR